MVTYTIDAARWRMGPQGGKYWSWYVTTSDGEVHFDHGFSTKREAVATAERFAERRGWVAK